jgi:hypothetical protein
MRVDERQHSIEHDREVFKVDARRRRSPSFKVARANRRSA